MLLGPRPPVFDGGDVSWVLTGTHQCAITYTVLHDVRWNERVIVCIHPFCGLLEVRVAPLRCACPVLSVSGTCSSRALYRLDEICVPLEVSLSTLFMNLHLMMCFKIDLSSHLSLSFAFVRMFTIVKHCFVELSWSRSSSRSSRPRPSVWLSPDPSGQFQTEPNLDVSIRFSRLRFYAVVVLIFVTSVVIEKSFISAGMCLNGHTKCSVSA